MLELHIKSFLELYGEFLVFPDKVQGYCDEYSMAFLERVGQGYLLCCGIPKREPTIGYRFWGNPESISHYVAVVGETVIDFTARQFWHDCEVPMIFTKQQFEELWDDIAWDCDARTDLKLDGLI
jgi:hypothetical protein